MGRIPDGVRRIDREYVFLTASNSEAEIDQRFSEDPKIGAALSDDDKKKIRELRSASIETERVELYSANPAQSYVTDDYIQADPGFWKPKPQLRLVSQLNNGAFD